MNFRRLFANPDLFDFRLEQEFEKRIRSVSSKILFFLKKPLQPIEQI